MRWSRYKKEVEVEPSHRMSKIRISTAEEPGERVAGSEAEQRRRRKSAAWSREHLAQARVGEEGFTGLHHGQARQRQAQILSRTFSKKILIDLRITEHHSGHIHAVVNYGCIERG